MGQKVIGRAFPISAKDAKSYNRARPRRLRPNPIGVTTIAAVNGRGAYSARSAAAGKSRSERLARARRLAKGGGSMHVNRAKFVKPAKANSKSKLKSNPAKRRGGKRLAAFNAARRRGLNKNSAARSALRRVPFTANERKRKTRFAGVTARLKRNKDTAAEQKKYEEGWERTFGKKAEEKPKRSRKPKKEKPVAGKAAAKGKGGKGKGKGKGKRTKRARAQRWPAQHRKIAATRKVKKVVRAKTTRKQRVAYGPYRRARLFNPRTGRMEYSYYYRTKKGTYRRIPAWAVGGAKSQGEFKKSGFKAGGGPKAWERTQRARKRAAERVLREGGVFTPNKGKKGKRKKGKSKRRSAYWTAYRRARAEGATVAQAKRIARGEKKMARRGRKKTTTTKRKTRGGRKTKRATAKKRGRGKSKRRGTKAARAAAAKKGWRKRKAKAGKRRAAKRRAKAKRKGGKRKGGKRAMRKNRGRRSYASNRRRGKRRSYRKNRRRSYRRNQGFMKTLVGVLKTGALVTSGFLTHRLLTALASEYLLGPLMKPAEGEAATETQLSMAKWSKPIAGVVVGGAGIALVSAVVKDERTKLSIGAGMFASWLHSTVVTLLMAAEQPKIAAQFEGYSNSLAYQLRGNRRRRARSVRGMMGMRGLGAATSIMPQYAPVGRLGAAPPFVQAAAGMGRFQQAAAGTGEYFQANSVGEYFAPRGTQGVGAYEAAGPLAMQAAANGVGQVIEDGIRPDDDLDRVLDLAESAAGLGEYYAAQRDNGGFVENRVPTQSQWIPHGPLWAGTLGVKGTAESSELPAGILATAGGNGVLSG